MTPTLLWTAIAIAIAIAIAGATIWRFHHLKDFDRKKHAVD